MQLRIDLQFAKLAMRRVIRFVVVAIALSALAWSVDTRTALSARTPSSFAFEPGVNSSPQQRNIRFLDGSSHQALLIQYQSRITYQIPEGQVSLHAVLLRADAAILGQSNQSNRYNSIRVRFLLDGKVSYDTVLDDAVPPEQVVLVLGSAKTLTIAVDQMLAGGALYLVDAYFSTASGSEAASWHLLTPGQGYVSTGKGAAQLAFHTYFPQQIVPLIVELSSPSDTATLNISLRSRQQPSAFDISTPVALHLVNGVFMGIANWKVPSVLGPAVLNLTLVSRGKQIYQRQVDVAVIRQTDIAQQPESSTFGIHLSSAGIPYLADSFAYLWGAKWGRVFIRWEIVEFERGHYDWSRIDDVVDLYLSQHMEILGVLGETVPRWASATGPQTTAAFNDFVRAAVAHLKSKVRYWDVYNEIDSKYHAGILMDKNDATADIHVLRNETDLIHGQQPDAELVCCSTGTSYWLAYDKRLFDAGIFGAMNIISLHPYESGPPEGRDGVMTYTEMIDNLRKLERTYKTDKPVWSSEANWLIGSPSQPGVTAPYVDEHSQSQYLVRVNLLSMSLGVPYFAHAPFSTPFHRDLLLDSLASYANMAHMFAGATNTAELQPATGVYAVSAHSGLQTVCALWTTRRTAAVRVSGLNNLQVQDMYGNTVRPTSSSLALSGDPVYLLGMGEPSISVLQVATLPTPKPLPPLSAWSKSSLASYSDISDGIHFTTRLANYGNLLKSPAIPVIPNSCYVLTAKMQAHSGGIAMLAIDGDTGKRVGLTLDIFSATGEEMYEPALKLRTGLTSELQVEIIADNPNDPQVTDFDVMQPQIARCEEQAQ